MSEKIPERTQQVQGGFLNPEPFFHAVLHLTQDGILFVNLKGVVLALNPTAKKILNLGSLDMRGKKFWDFLPDGYFGFSVRDALLFGTSHRLIYRSYPSKELEITTSFVRENLKEEQGILILFRDITERVHAHTLHNRASQMEKLGEMTATTTHEIRNPLGGIRGYASLLYRDLKDQSHLRDMAGKILEGAKSLEHLISNLLDYARPLQISPVSIEVGPFLRQFIQFIKVDPMCPKNLHWNIHIPEEPIIAPIDKEAFRSILFNLCINAFQAMPSGGVLTISLLQTGDAYQISISDTGIGMDDEQVEQLFSPLFTTKKQGNGLGLLQVQKMVQSHFGTIHVRSTLHQGTSFTLTFPMRRGL